MTDDKGIRIELPSAEFVASIEQAEGMFDRMCAERMEKGRTDYGALAFLGNDVVRMLMEELVDIANYSRMQFVKLAILQGQFEDLLVEKGVTPTEAGDIGIGFNSFKGVGEGWQR